MILSESRYFGFLFRVQYSAEEASSSSRDNWLKLRILDFLWLKLILLEFFVKRNLQLVRESILNIVKYCLHYMSELKTRTILFEALTLGEDEGEGGEEPQR